MPKEIAVNLQRTGGERGQVLPLWSAAVVICFALSFMVLNYGNQIRWQIRAQNAADSAAAAAVGIQAERFNLIMMMLYASNVEEFRARRLFDGLFNSVMQSGGCTYTRTGNIGSTAFGSCGYVYAKLHDPFIRSVNRFNADAQQLQEFHLNDEFSSWTADSQQLMTSLQTNCNVPGTPIASYNPSGGDCSFYYSIAPNGIVGRTSIHATSEDAESILVPDLGRVSSIPDDTQGALWTPGEIDVVTCAVIPPIVPNFGPFHFAPVYAVGRGAATTALVEQDWMQPGALKDPARTGSIANFNYFQPVEDYVDLPANHDFVANCTSTNSSTCMQSTASIAWYNVDYGGQTTSASSTNNVFTAPLAGSEMDVRTGWWGSLPIKPFGKAPTLNSTTCHP